MKKFYIWVKKIRGEWSEFFNSDPSDDSKMIVVENHNHYSLVSFDFAYLFWSILLFFLFPQFWLLFFENVASIYGFIDSDLTSALSYFTL